jgi:hypothetical protein
MPTPIEKAIAHLNKLEADRTTAIALSEQKAQEAELIKARLEGFHQALEILSVNISLDTAEVSPPIGKSERRRRRNIPQFISNELSFSGKAMTTNQIARAIDYLPDRTEKALERMESSGQIVRTRDGRWALPGVTAGEVNGHAMTVAPSGLGGSRGAASLQE